MPDVCILQDSGSETWNTWLSYFVRYRQPQNAIKDFGLEKHPLWQGLLQSLAAFPKRRSGSSRQMWRALAMLLYYNDPEASYHQYVQARQKNKEKRAARNKAEENWRKQFLQKQQVSLDGIRRVAASDHLRDMLMSGHIYSAPQSVLPLRSLPEALAPPSHANQVVQRDTTARLEGDVTSAETQLAAQARDVPIVYFRVIRTGGFSKKSNPIASSKWLELGSI